MICVAMASVGLILSSLIEREYTAGYQRILTSHTKLVKSVLEIEYLSNGRFNNPDNLCYDLSLKINARVQILNNDGRVIGDSRRGIGNSDSSKKSSEKLKGLGCRVCHPEARSDAIFEEQPIVYLNHKVAKTRVFASLYGVDEVAASTRRVIFTVLIIAALIAAVISPRLASSITKPIIQMNAIAKKMAEGDIHQRVQITGADEIGQLAISFDAMALQIEKMLSEIAEDRDRVETILATMADGIIIVDNTGRIVLFNRASEGIFRRETSTVLSKPIGESDLHPDLDEMVQETLRKRRLVRKELRLSAGKGEIILSAYSLPIRDQASAVKGAVVVIHDLTEIRAHERAQKEFVANVSHELRTPITAVRVTAEALLAGAKDDPALLERFLKTQVNESERLSSMIDNLLEIAQKEAGRRKPNKSNVELYELASRIVTLHKAESKHDNNEIILDIPDDLLIYADRQQLSQVLSNLIDNAVKYTPQGGMITINAEAKDSSVYLSVSDTGIGIPNDEVPHVFERFYRVDKARSRRLGGTGLGLSIVKDIVEAHGGTITVDTELGRGSTFTVILPKSSQ